MLANLKRWLCLEAWVIGHCSNAQWSQPFHNIPKCSVPKRSSAHAQRSRTSWRACLVFSNVQPLSAHESMRSSIERGPIVYFLVYIYMYVWILSWRIPCAGVGSLQRRDRIRCALWVQGHREVTSYALMPDSGFMCREHINKHILPTSLNCLVHD